MKITGAAMSEDKTNYWPPLPARRDAPEREEQPTDDQRIAHLGRLALAWARAQVAWEDAPRHDLVGVGQARRKADMADDRLRVACLAALAARPMLGAEGCGSEEVHREG